MTNEVEKKEDGAIFDLKNTQKLCDMLMQYPRYQKMGPEGIFAIVQKARSVGLNPLDAVNGSLWFTPQGKVEMSAETMNELIRRAGHSITKDKKSDDNICILHGKRADSGDTWCESFSIEDAKRAKIYRNVWFTYPRNMCFARALSNLARQLFPDVIKGCYVEGEISDAAPLHEERGVQSLEYVDPPIEQKLVSEEQVQQMKEALSLDPEFENRFRDYIEKKYDSRSLAVIPESSFEFLYERVLTNVNKEQTQEA